MGYVFKQIEISNFKYILSDHPAIINFRNSNIVILNGQNGYGKTTLFDAIELLLTGTIKHFNAELLNRGSETIGILANDQNKDIVIKGWLYDSDNKEFILVRKLNMNNNNLSSCLFLNNIKITQQDLYEKLKINDNMFNIGVYISQSQSLNFLQNKYKTRKEQLSMLLINPEITQKIQILKDIQQQLKIRINEQIKKLEKQNEFEKNQVEMLKNKIKDIQNLKGPCSKNIILFPDKNYPFDLVNIEDGVKYDEFIDPLNQIESFIRNYDEYIINIQNREIEKILKISPQIYKALFYSEQISLLKRNKSLLETINKCKNLLKELQNYNWIFDASVFLSVGIPKELCNRIKSLIQLKQKAQNKLKSSDIAILQLNKARETLIQHFYNITDEEGIPRNTCPLCGTKLLNIQKAFDDTEKALLDIQQDRIQQSLEVEKKIKDIYLRKVIPAFEKFLSQNKEIIKISDEFDYCKNLSTEKLYELLNKWGINDFYSKNKYSFNLDEFFISFERIKGKLQQNVKPVKTFISNEEIEAYQFIHETYYNNKKPKHSINQIKYKRQYIANQFINSFSKMLVEAKTKYNKVSEKLNSYLQKSKFLQETMRMLINKYEESYKDYQSLLSNAIKLPLMIYSGKIIQNYPLGLGIKTVIKTNQLVFESMSKEGVDVYNVLSTGQLNGLAIAILLSIRNVYGDPFGLDVLLIDDPLQTMDDISSISLVDLLLQQKIGQVILSTHENQKARMLKFKYERNNLTVCERNMQHMYLSLNQN